MSKTGIVLGVFGAVALLEMARKGTVNTALQNLSWSFGRITFDFANVIEVRGALPVTIVNENSVSVTIYSVTGNLYYGSSDLGSVSISAPVELISGEAATTTVALNTTVLALGDQLYDLIANGNYLGTLRFKGMISTSIGDIELNENIQIAQ